MYTLGASRTSSELVAVQSRHPATQYYRCYSISSAFLCASWFLERSFLDNPSVERIGKSPGELWGFLPKILQNSEERESVVMGALHLTVFGILLSESLSSESLLSESLTSKSLSREESQCGFPYFRNPCPRNPWSRNSHLRNSWFRTSHLRNFSQIQAPLNQTPLRLPPKLSPGPAPR